jgi:hypothetical protein
MNSGLIIEDASFIIIQKNSNEAYGGVVLWLEKKQERKENNGGRNIIL